MASFTPPELRCTRRDALRGVRVGGPAVRAADAHAAARRRRRRAAAAAPVPGRAAAPADARAGEPRTPRSLRLTIREGRAEIIPGEFTPVYGYDGIYPGPTIRARKGRTTVVQVTNGLPFHQNIHLHGGRHAGGQRRPSDAADRARRLVHVHVPERPGRGDALVPRPRPRAVGPDDVLRAGRVLHRRGRPRGRSSASRPATSTCRW